MATECRVPPEVAGTTPWSSCVQSVRVETETPWGVTHETQSTLGGIGGRSGGCDRAGRGRSGSAQAAPNAGTVRTWNANALAALGAAGQPPNVAVLHMAMVQGAVYDAVNSIDGGHEPFLAGLPAASPTASMDAAVATAAYRVLDGLGRAPVPALPDAVRATLLVQYNQTLASIPDGPAKTLGVEAGAAAATAMLEARDGDGRYVPFPLTVGTEPGEWRPTPPANAIDPNSWISEVDPFTLLSTSQFRTPGPRNLNSAAYAHEYNEVKSLGAVEQPAQPGAGGDRPLLQRQPGGAAQPHVPDHLRRRRG